MNHAGFHRHSNSGRSVFLSKVVAAGLLAGYVTTAYAGQPFVPNDPYYFTDAANGLSGQWHIDRQTSGALIDANVAPVWAKGWTGQGVTIAVIEGGMVEATHPDLAANYNASLSYNANASSLPLHSTSVAGVAAGRGGNGIGTTGVAPYAKFASIGMTLYAGGSGDYEVQRVSAVRHRNDVIKVQNHSYGDSSLFNSYNRPTYLNGGVYYEGDKELASAYADAINAGVIIVRGAGNSRGATLDYSANLNFYSDRNDPGLIIVGAVGSNGTYAPYSSYGSNLTVASPSLTSTTLSATPSTRGITTTDVSGSDGYGGHPDNAYTTLFSGTSSATPVVSGVMALGLEAQPNLNARFAKHLLARTSTKIDSTDSSPTGGWVTNAAGVNFNNNYGFGLINADAFVTAAQQYTGVSALTEMHSGTIGVGQYVPEDDAAGLVSSYTFGEGGPLEEVSFTLSYNNPGSGSWRSIQQLDIELISPSGTISPLQYASSNMDLVALYESTWTYVSNAFWGEAPSGLWQVRFRDEFSIRADETNLQSLINSYSLDLRSGTLVAVPEPTTATLLLGGAGVLSLRRRRVGKA